MKKQMLRQEKGITLIALIITIIILVILAAVSINSVYNMKIVGKAIQGVQQYAQKTAEENKIMDNTTQLVGNTVKRLDAIQGKVPEELQKYVMGADGTGRRLGEIYGTVSGSVFGPQQFKDGTEEDIVDASTSVVYMNKLIECEYQDPVDNASKDVTYYIYAKYKDIGYKIKVRNYSLDHTNYTMTAGVEVVYVPKGMEGQIVHNFKVKTEDEEGIDWLIIYDNGNTVDMTPITLGESDDWKCTLGNGDPTADVAIPSDSLLEKSQYSRIHMLENLNAKCEALVTNLNVQRVRSIGTQFDRKDTTEKYSSAILEVLPTGDDVGKYNGVGLVGDMNCEQDVVRISYYSSGDTYQKYGYAKTGKNYFLASRFVSESVGHVYFGARVMGTNGAEAVNTLGYLWEVNTSFAIRGYQKHCVRPVARVEKTLLRM